MEIAGINLSITDKPYEFLKNSKDRNGIQYVRYNCLQCGEVGEYAVKQFPQHKPFVLSGAGAKSVGIGWITCDGCFYGRTRKLNKNFNKCIYCAYRHEECSAFKLGAKGCTDKTIRLR